jgi:membrane bound O-acyltransferase family protein
LPDAADRGKDARARQGPRVIVNSSLVHWLVWLPGCVVFASLASQLVAPSGWRRHAALSLSGVSLAAPWLAPSGTVLRAAVALYLLWTCAKVLDMARDPTPRSAYFRWLWMLVLHDLRRDGYARHGPRRELRVGLLLGAVTALGLTLLCLHVALFVAEPLSPVARALVRQSAGLAACYLGVEGALRAFELVERALGAQPPLLHDHPILSLSLAEFWGRRWNRVVGHWLFATFYRPFARGGRAAAGVTAAFLGSALLHFYFTCAAIGAAWGLVMASFFVLQVPLVLLERKLGQARWPAPWRRIWTIGCLVLTAPLFVEPTLRTLAGGYR